MDNGVVNRAGSTEKKTVAALKIAVWHNQSSGGAKRALFEGVRWLHAQGHTIDVWCPPSADLAFLPLSPFAQEHVVPLGPFEVPGALKWAYGRVGAKTHMLEKLSALAVHNQCAADEINAGHFDVLLATTCQWLSVPSIAPLIKAPTVLYLQEPYRFLHEAAPVLPWLEEPDKPSGLAGRLLHFLGSSLRVHPFRLLAREELRGVLAFDRVLVNSFFSRESVLRAYGVDAHVCYLGIDAARFLNYSGARAPVVLCVGQLHALKNPEFIIRAVALARTRPTLRWVCNVVHDGDYRRRLEELAQSLGVALDIRVRVTDEELVKHYQEATVLAYAPRLEPFGYAPLEANACGLPVVAVAEGGVRETVLDGANGLLVENVEGMAAAIDQLMADPVRGRELGQRGAEIVRECWTLEAAGARLERHLLAAAGRPTAAGFAVEGTAAGAHQAPPR